MLRSVPETTSHELCDCPRRDHVDSVDGHCVNQSVRSEDPESFAGSRYSECGCCMADCPDVHPEPSPGRESRPGSVTVTAEYAATLPAEKQEDLREREAKGEIRIVPRAEISQLR